MNIIYNYGLDSALMRYYSGTKDPTARTSTFSTAIWLTLATSAILSVIIFSMNGFFSRWLLEDVKYAQLMKYSAAILCLDCICHVPFALLRLEEKPYQFMGIKLLNVFVIFSLNIYFVVILKRGVTGIFQSNLITSAFTALVVYIVTLSRMRFTFSGKTAKDLTQFGLPFIPAGLATVCMEMLNRYILQDMIGLEAVGIFSAGFKLGIFMLLLTTAFYYAWQPFFLKAGPQESSRTLFSRIFTYFVLIELSFWLLLTAFMHEIVHFHIGNMYLIGKEYQSCETMVPFILLGYVFLGMNQVFLPGIYFEKKTRYLAYLTIFAAAVNVGANYIFIPLFGMVGSAYSSLAGYLALAVSGYFVSQRLFRVPYELRRVAFLFVLALGGGIPILIFNLPLVVRFFIALAFPICLKFFGFFRKDEIESIRQIFNRRVLKA
jgi:O-antigen/teichoic acid export membrane protein